MSWLNAVADRGFPRRGGANPRGERAPTYDFAKFPQILHEIERIWTGIDPPLTMGQTFEKKREFMSPVSPNLAGERIPSSNIIFSLTMLRKRLMRSVHAIINGFSGVTPIYSSPITFIHTSIPNPNHQGT